MARSEPDRHFGDPRLAGLYDLIDSDRSDLDVYAGIAEEVGARSVLDIGCGTGTLACRLAAEGRRVTAVDPAVASLDVARRKRHAGRVRWVEGTAEAALPLEVDLVVMTANVAQVFLTDTSWRATLAAARAALHGGGRLVFEVRDPEARAWEAWVPARTRRRVELPGVGSVLTWIEVTEVALPLVSFRTAFVFEAAGERLDSDSTLRFRSRQELAADLASAGFVLDGVRDAPDRPGRELVVVARRRPED